MSLFEGFDVELNENSLDAFLGIDEYQSTPSSHRESSYPYQDSDKNCVTYQWALSDDDPQSPNS